MRSHAFDGSKTPAASSPDACFPATAGRMRSMVAVGQTRRAVHLVKVCQRPLARPNQIAHDKASPASTRPPVVSVFGRRQPPCHVLTTALVCPTATARSRSAAPVSEAPALPGTRNSDRPADRAAQSVPKQEHDRRAPGLPLSLGGWDGWTLLRPSQPPAWRISRLSSGVGVGAPEVHACWPCNVPGELRRAVRAEVCSTVAANWRRRP